MPGNGFPSETKIGREIECVLSDRLPDGWSLASEFGTGNAHVDLLVEIWSPDGEKVSLAIDVRRTLEPRFVRSLVQGIPSLGGSIAKSVVPIAAAGYLSARTRELLREAGVGYVDTTGNVDINTSSPGLRIFTQGADRDPWPQNDGLQSLRGRGAAVAVRAIIDAAPPYGVRQLASMTKASAATLSRVLGLLEREAIITRESRGPVEAVDWRAAIRRWAEDYDQAGSNTPTAFLDPRGILALENKLVDAPFEYAATGAFAAQRFNPVAPARTAALYVDDVIEAAGQLDLRETDDGANVVLLEPFDRVVYERTVVRDGLRCVAPSQLSVDLLTGPGREPSQGEELLRWMGENEDVWRT